MFVVCNTPRCRNNVIHILKYVANPLKLYEYRHLIKKFNVQLSYFEVCLRSDMALSVFIIRTGIVELYAELLVTRHIMLLGL